MVQGKDLTLGVKESDTDEIQTLCYGTSCSLELSNELLETAPDVDQSGKTRTFIYGQQGTKISHSGLLSLDQYNLFEAARLQKTLYWSFRTDKDGGLEYSGTCLIDSSSISGDPSGFATIQTALTVSGDIVMAEIGYTRDIYLTDGYGRKVPATFPMDVFSVHGEIIGKAASLEQFLTYWKLDYYNAKLGTLVSDGDNEYILQANYNSTEIPVSLQVRPNTDINYMEDGNGNQIFGASGNLLILDNYK